MNTLIFNEFFESDREESISPFLTPKSRKWGQHLLLRSSFLAAFFLLTAFILTCCHQETPISHLLLLFTYFFAGIPALIGAIEDLTKFEINIDILMTLAAFSAVLIGSAMEGALLLVLFAFSGALEEAVRSKAKGAISSLQKLSPAKAFVLQNNGSLLECSVRSIEVGECIVVKAGEVVALDGEVVAGISSVNLSHLTGESTFVTKKVGDTVPAGAGNQEGSLTLKVTHTSGDSTLAKIITLVTQASEAKPKLQRWFDRISHGYAMAIILLSFVLATSLPFLFDIAFLGKEGSIYRALAFLIAASPCALIIAIPIAYLSAISSLAKGGIIVKGGVVLDALACCQKVALDKTGTLTTGELICEGLESLNPLSKDQRNELLSIAYGLEHHAVHPVAASLVAYACAHSILPAKIAAFRQIPGYGVEGIFQKQRAVLGKADLVLPLASEQERSFLETNIKIAQQQGETIALLYAQQRVVLFRFKDSIRPHAKTTLDILKEQGGLDFVMLTGDHKQSAHAVAQKVGIKEVHAALSPEEKLDLVDALAQKTPLAMVGDGINDAPALARAHVGISMSEAGSRAAADASDVVFLRNSFEALISLFSKAKKTTRIVRQNVCLAAVAIVLASLPALLGMIPLWLAVILHEGGTVFVGLNALRLLKK